MFLQDKRRSSRKAQEEKADHQFWFGQYLVQTDLPAFDSTAMTTTLAERASPISIFTWFFLDLQKKLDFAVTNT